MKAAGTSASELGGGGGEECSPLQGMLQLYFGWQPQERQIELLIAPRLQDPVPIPHHEIPHW